MTKAFSVVFVTLMIWIAATQPAEATCTGSNVYVTSLPTFVRTIIPVMWRVEPACDVVETGLMMGTDPANLTAVGQPVYGLEAIYQQELTVSEPGAYWIAAYVRDESGNIVYSRAHPALMTSLFPTGSHNLLASSALSKMNSVQNAFEPLKYTGTDADFLQPTGDTHFASLKSMGRTAVQETWETRPGFPNPITIHTTSGQRDSGSTLRVDVQKAQSQPLQLPDSSITFGTPLILNALAQADNGFTQRRFPRSGFYYVVCFKADTQSCFPAFGDAFFGTSQRRFDNNAPKISNRLIQTSSGQSSGATFFIPRSPEGKKVQTAKLQSIFGAMGSMQDASAGPRINGKSAIVSDVRCFDSELGIPGLTQCLGTAVWDFTDEVASLSNQGGGEFTITMDPMPLFEASVPNPFQGTTSISEGSAAIGLVFNYPWQEASPVGALTIKFAADCSIDIVATPETIAPQRVGLSSRAEIEAKVKDCTPSAERSEIVITLQIDPDLPIPGTAESGGHAHGGTRPKGGFDVPGGSSTTQCTVILDASGAGSCSVSYFSSEVSGVETIIARAQDLRDEEKQITIEVPGLVNLAGVASNFLRLTRQLPQHPDNHWGTENTLTYTQLVALDFFEAFGATLGINDISLPSGGLFDISGAWRPPHILHRKGTSVDIDGRACLDPNLDGGCGKGIISADKRFIGQRCFVRGQGVLAREPSIHCEFPR